MLERRTRARRGEIDRAALELLANHGAQILATARRYAATPEDAEDAYQRGLEILLTKAPTTREEELVPWLKTVVKHEAFALRRQRERLTPVTGDGDPIERGTPPAATHEEAERYERLHQGAEALRRLKPQEVRCLVLKAQGLSYREICDETGWTYTKVNRCLTEGRQALATQVAGIEGGIECARLAPLLSALADGEATTEQIARLRPHMKSCLACRARLREFRAAPARVAALLPAAALAAPSGNGSSRIEVLVGAAQQKVEALLGATQHKAAVFAERAQTTAELLTANKIAAVAASAAALAGGGTAVDQLANHHGPPRPAVTHQAPPSDAKRTGSTEPTRPRAAVAQRPATTVSIAKPNPSREPPHKPDPANEFAPTGEFAPAGASASRSQASASDHQAPTAATPSEPARPAPPVPGAGGEFAP